VLELLIAIRAAHYAATVVAAGTVLFSVLVSDPVWRPADACNGARKTRRILFAALAVAIVTLAAWLMMLAVELADGHWREALTDGTCWALLTETQFGRVAEVRTLAAVTTAGLFVAGRTPLGSACCRSLAAVAACFLLATLAWVGHAGAAYGGTGWLHLAGDAAHLLAAGAWIGGLVPLFAYIGDSAGQHGQLAELRRALRRFSFVGTSSVVVLLMSGALSTYFLTDELRALFGTDYGALIQLKFLLFVALLGLAATNRFALVPRLSDEKQRHPAEAAPQALRWLRTTVALEIFIGLGVLVLAAKLGMMPPAGHSHH
jgi:putative copper resistance protein D